MIIGPPGEPAAILNLPSGPNTMVGDIALIGRLPGAGALATGFPSRAGSKEKSVSSLLRKNPFAIISEPNTYSTVVVIDTTSPELSTTERWLVPGSCGVRCGANGVVRRRRRAGLRLSHVLLRIDQQRRVGADRSRRASPRPEHESHRDRRDIARGRRRRAARPG